MLNAMKALSPKKADPEPNFNEIPNVPDASGLEASGSGVGGEEGSGKKKKKADVELQNYYYEKMSKDRTESHVLEELDTANVNVTEDEEEDELARERAIQEEEEMAAARALLEKNTQTTRFEDGKARIFFIKTTWSVEFVHLLHYVIFLALITVVTLGRPTIQRYFVHTALHDNLVDQFNARKEVVPYEMVNTKEQFFDWMRWTFTPTLFPELESPRQFPNGTKNDYDTKVAMDMGYRLGTVRVRQLRVEDGSCNIPKRFQRAVTRCHAKFLPNREDMEDFKANLGALEPGVEWQSEGDLGTGNFYSHVTKQIYEGSGFEYFFDVTASDTAETWQTLYDTTWVDFGTRMVSIDFTIYNPAIDLLVWGTHVVEFMPSGDVIPTFHFRVFDEWKYLRVWDGDDTDGSVGALLVVELILYAYVVSYMWEEFREMFYWGPKEYFQSWMNIAELLNLLVFFNTAAFRFLAFQEIGVLAESFADDDSFLDMRTFGTYSQVAMNLLACNALMSYCKVFKYLKFHRGITQFVETIYEATFEVTVFLTVLLVIIVSYGLSFHIAFGHVSRSYMDFAEALFTMFKSTMGQFTIREIETVNSSGRYLGPFLFLSFIMVNLFVVLSMLYAMVRLSYRHVRDQMLNEELHPENSPIVQDLTRLLTGWLRIIQKIPGIQGKEFTEQSMIRRRKRVAMWLSGESELIRRARAKKAREKARELEMLGEEAKERLAMGDDDDLEVRPLVKDPRKDLLATLVEVEAKQRQMLTGIENLSRTVRAQTFNAINKQMEDIVNE
ncbi:hypothetical protein TrVE_jg2135 [Triparma verrucosa]|uniref:Polycystin-2 n=1 Tax=Triparma verrucosa TaxID=1606542 RepID=A0A9W7B2P4_9STRA|nr:hypothetical protein TrVE_jg2135 [Triparma verrucosa]